MSGTAKYKDLNKCGVPMTKSLTEPQQDRMRAALSRLVTGHRLLPAEPHEKLIVKWMKGHRVMEYGQFFYQKKAVQL